MQLNGFIPRLTFDLMNLIDANIWDGKLIFYDSLYYMEQFESIFIQIGAIWTFDPLYKSASIRIWKANAEYHTRLYNVHIMNRDELLSYNRKLILINHLISNIKKSNMKI